MKTCLQVTLQFQYVIWDDIETSYVKCLGIVDIGSHATKGCSRVQKPAFFISNTVSAVCIANVSGKFRIPM